MPDELEALLRLVAEGKLTAEEAAPLVNALQQRQDVRADEVVGTPGAERTTEQVSTAPDAVGRGTGTPEGGWTAGPGESGETRLRADERRRDARRRADEARNHADEARARRAHVAGAAWWRVGSGADRRDHARSDRDGRRDAREEGRDATPSARAALEGRRLRIRITEEGRSLINLQMPLVAAGAALDRIPGLSPDDRSRIVQAIRTGMTGPILDVRDDDDEVLIVIE